MAKTPRDLTDEQNEALRPLVRQAIDMVGNQSRLEDETGWSQSAISGFLSGRQGASYPTAFQICAMVGVDAFGLLGIRLPSGLATPSSMKIGTLLLKLRELTSLHAAIVADPGRWTVSTVVRAVSMPYQSDDELPKGGWAIVLDGIQSGRETLRTGTTADVRAETRRAHKRRPVLP